MLSVIRASTGQADSPDHIFARAYPGQPEPQALVFAAQKPTRGVLLRLYSTEDYANRITIEKQETAGWVKVRLQKLEFVPAAYLNTKQSLRIEFVEDIKPGEKFRLLLDDFQGERLILLRGLIFLTPEQCLRPMLHFEASDGYINLNDAISGAVFQPYWFRLNSLQKKMRANLPKEYTPARQRQARQFVRRQLALPDLSELTWLIVKEEDIPFQNFPDRIARKIVLRTARGTILETYMSLPRQIDGVFIFAAGSFETGGQALDQLTPLFEAPHFKNSVIICPTISHAVFGNEITSYALRPDLGNQPALGVLTEELATIVNYAYAQYRDKPVTLSGYSMGAQLSLLTSGAYDVHRTLLWMPPRGMADMPSFKTSRNIYQYMDMPDADFDVFAEAVAGTKSPLFLFTHLESSIAQTCALLHPKWLVRIKEKPPFSPVLFNSVPDGFFAERMER
jgi:hypothetical protein